MTAVPTTAREALDEARRIRALWQGEGYFAHALGLNHTLRSDWGTVDLSLALRLMQGKRPKKPKRARRPEPGDPIPFRVLP